MPARPLPLRSIVISAAMAALALTLPVAFHPTGLGNKFLPMLLPLLVNGFLVPARWAMFTGAAVPLISSLATGMPPLYPPVALVMSAEGALLGGVAAAVHRGGRGNVWVALAAAVFAGRGATFALTWLLARVFALPPALTAAAVIVQGLPGVALQVAVVPLALHLVAARRSPLFSKEPPHEA